MESGFILYRPNREDFYQGNGKWSPLITFAYVYDTLANAKAGAVPFRRHAIKIINIHVPTRLLDADPTDE